jgi:DNA-binding response OmpR family regulator
VICQQIRVLVVDNRVENRESTRSLLASEGYTSQEAHTVTDAIEQIRASSIDLVLAHVQMERSDDGLELLRRVKAARPTIPVILYTGFGSIRDAVFATKLGAADYLEWPLAPDLIRATVRNALKSASGQPHSETESRMSSSTRWAAYVLKAVESPEDIKTLLAWARRAAVSYTTLREACYLLRIQPEDARDFARALRVVVGLSRGSNLMALLDTSDRRSLQAFCLRTGLSPAIPQAVTVRTFLRCQTLIAPDNEGLIAVDQALKL